MKDLDFLNSLLPAVDAETQQQTLEELANRQIFGTVDNAINDPIAQIKQMFEKCGSHLATYHKNKKPMLAYAVEGYFVTDAFVANANVWDLAARSFVAIFGDDNKEAKDDKSFFHHTTLEEFIDLFPMQCDGFKDYIKSL